MSWKVVLDKGSKGQRVWEHETERGARQRAEALAHLHHAFVEWVGQTFTVKAAHYYEDTKET